MGRPMPHSLGFLAGVDSACLSLPSLENGTASQSSLLDKKESRNRGQTKKKTRGEGRMEKDDDDCHLHILRVWYARELRRNYGANAPMLTADRTTFNLRTKSLFVGVTSNIFNPFCAGSFTNLYWWPIFKSQEWLLLVWFGSGAGDEKMN